MITGDASGSVETLHARRTIISKEIIKDAARSAARVFRTPADISRHGTDRTTPQDGNTDIGSTRLYSPVRIGGSTTGSPIRTGSQILSVQGGPSVLSGAGTPNHWTLPLMYSKHRYPEPTLSKVIGHKFTNKSSADINSLCWTKLTRDTVLSKIPYFVNLGISSVHTADELGPVFILTTRIRTPTNGSNWLPPGHSIGEITAERVIRTGSDKDYNAKTDFENRRGNQYFGHQNNSMSRPPLDSIRLGMNTTNITTSPIDSIP